MLLYVFLLPIWRFFIIWSCYYFSFYIMYILLFYPKFLNFCQFILDPYFFLVFFSLSWLFFSLFKFLEFFALLILSSPFNRSFFYLASSILIIFKQILLNKHLHYYLISLIVFFIFCLFLFFSWLQKKTQLQADY